MKQHDHGQAETIPFSPNGTLDSEAWYVNSEGVFGKIVGLFWATSGPRIDLVHSEAMAPEEGKPTPPEAWEGRFIAIYPDGNTSDFDLAGTVIRPGDEIGDTGYILERWDVTDEPMHDGKYMAVGYLRKIEESRRASSRSL